MDRGPGSLLAAFKAAAKARGLVREGGVVSKKAYIGDAVYVEFDGYGIELSTLRAGVRHYIYLEPEVFDSLLLFRDMAYEVSPGIGLGDDKQDK